MICACLIMSGRSSRRSTDILAVRVHLLTQRRSGGRSIAREIAVRRQERRQRERRNGANVTAVLREMRGLRDDSTRVTRRRDHTRDHDMTPLHQTARDTEREKDTTDINIIILHQSARQYYKTRVRTQQVALTTLYHNTLN